MSNTQINISIVLYNNPFPMLGKAIKNMPNNYTKNNYKKFYFTLQRIIYPKKIENSLQLQHIDKKGLL